MESDVRENIKNSALQLFNEPGYDATGIRELSAQAGCSLPMMYYYFESKEKLLHEIAVKDFVSLVDDIFAQAVKKNNLMDFALCFIGSMDSLKRREKLTMRLGLLLHMGVPSGMEDTRKVLVQHRYQKEQELKELLFDIWGTSRFLEEKTRMLYRLIYSALISMFLTNRPVSLKRVADDIEYLIR